MKVILSLEVDLIRGTPTQLFQDLIDGLAGDETINRGPDGEVFLHYGIAVEAVRIDTEIYMPEEAKPWPLESD